MPLIGTLGAASAKGFGFGASTGGALNVINYITASARNTSFRSATYLSNGSVVSGGTLAGQYGLISPMTPAGVRSVYNSPTTYASICCTDYYVGDVWSVSSDVSDNYYVYGQTIISSGNINRTMFIAKYNSSGINTFYRQFTNLMTTNTGNMRIGKDGNMYIARQDKLSNPTGYINVLKLSVSGTPSISWQITRRSNNVQSWGTDVDADASGNIYVSAYNNPAGTYEGYVIKFDSSTATGNSGVVSWQRILTLSGVSVLVQCLRLDSANNVYVVATNGNANALYLVKYNSSGVLQWQRKVTSLATNYVGQIAIDSSDNIYIVWNLSNTNNVVLKYNSSGTIQWQRNISTATTNRYLYLSGIAVFGTKMSINGRSDGVSVNTATITINIPTDGTKTGTLGTVANSTVVSYAASAYTDAAGDLTDAAGGLSNDGNTSYTITTGSMYNGNQTVTSTSTVIA